MSPLVPETETQACLFFCHFFPHTVNELCHPCGWLFPDLTWEPMIWLSGPFCPPKGAEGIWTGSLPQFTQ